MQNSKKQNDHDIQPSDAFSPLDPEIPSSGPDQTQPEPPPGENDDNRDNLEPTENLDHPDESQNDPQPLDNADQPPAAEPEITTPAVLEAVLFAADEPISPQKIAEILATTGVKEIREHIEQLNQKYEQMQCSFRIESIAGGYQMLSLPRFNPWLRKLIKVRSETKLSPAALETLAIIAYKQPILRVDIEAIRGVAAGEMVRQLIEKGLVKIVGRADEPGRPLLYGTTKKFLEIFGLNTLNDLPSAQDLKKPD